MELDQTPEIATPSPEAADPTAGTAVLTPGTAAAEGHFLAFAFAQIRLDDPGQRSRDYAAAAAAPAAAAVAAAAAAAAVAAAGTAAVAAAAACDRLPSRQQSFESLPGSWVVLSWQHAESAGQAHSCRAQPGWLCSAS